jgi:hypothetical protein
LVTKRDDISRLIEHLFAAMQGERASVLGAWIRTFSWSSSFRPEMLRLYRDASIQLVHVLSTATHIQTLRLPFNDQHVPFWSLHSAPQSLRILSFGQVSMSASGLAFIASCRNLEELHVQCYQDHHVWPTVRWTLPTLRVFTLNSKFASVVRYLSQCDFENLKTLDLDISQESPLESDMGQLLASFLARLPALDSARLDVLEDVLPVIIPVVTAHTLDLPTSGRQYLEVIREVSPAVRTLKINLNSTLPDYSTIRILDDLLENGVTVEKVICRMWAEFAWTDDARGFTWAWKPDWYVNPDGNNMLGEVDGWEALMRFLRGYAQRMEERGIALCDSRGQTVREAESEARQRRTARR